MNWNPIKLPDSSAITSFLRLTSTPNAVFEIRALKVKQEFGRSAQWSGYYDYDHINNAVEHIVDLGESPAGVYITINTVKSALLARRANRMERADAGETTSDRDIEFRTTLLIDVDPDRPAGICATDAEHEAAIALSAQIKSGLTADGWPDPICVDSGNGGQLWYRINLPVEDGGLVTRTLAALGKKYDTNVVQIDQAVFNPARIGRLPGTVNRKGDDTPDRPHRIARVLSAPEKFEPVPVELLEKLAGPAAEAKSTQAHPKAAAWPQEAVQKFIDERLADCDPGEPMPYKGGMKWVLGKCPFDSSHTGGGAAVFHSAEGVPGFRCQHDSCLNHHWRGLAAKFGIDNRATTSAANGQAGGRPCAPCPTETATLFMQEALMRDGFPVVRHWRDNWYAFTDDGWMPVSDGEMMKRVLTWLQSKGGVLANFATVNYARNVLANLSAFGLCGIPAFVERPCWLSAGEDARNWVAFSNGIAVDLWRYAEALAAGVVPPADCFRKVTADLFSADFVNYAWTDQPSEPHLFLKYLNRVCPIADVLQAVWRMMGLLIVDVAKYEVFWQLLGLGANGKTVLLDILEALVGQQNVSRVSLESLAPGNRFQNFPLVSAKVNISGELSTDIGAASLAAIEGQFKHAVSGGIIEVEHKGVDKTFERCRARFVMSANSLPTFMDKSEAIWRRLRIIPFEVEIPEAERDVDLAKKIIATDMPGILFWALYGLADVIRLGRVPDCERGAALKAAHRASCDHEREFLLERYEPGTLDDKVMSSLLYAEYKSWMDTNRYRALGAARFKARVEGIFPTVRYADMRICAMHTKGYEGIRLKRGVAPVAVPESAYE